MQDRSSTDTQSAPEPSEISWTAYAEAYDLIPAFFPEYAENQRLLKSLLSSHPLPPQPMICDVGAGTGNYIIDISTYVSDAEFIHIDYSESMTELARRKYASHGLRPEIQVRSAIDATIASQSVDLIICVNALYNMNPQSQTLEVFRRWLKPSGMLFVIDFGRQQHVGDWLSQFLRNAVTGKIRARSYAKAATKGATLVRQALLGTKAQKSGTYWTHTPTEFAQTISAAGFRIEQQGQCYRGYCDFALATPVVVPTQPS